LDEAIEIIKKIWTQKIASYNGKYYKLDDANLYLKPSNNIPIFIAAHGKKSAFLADLRPLSEYVRRFVAFFFMWY